MSLPEIVTTIVLLLTVVLGLIGLVAPRYVMDLLDLQTGETTQGMAELRAVNGAMFVGLGLGALLLESRDAALLVGFGYLAAGAGRLVSMALDGSGTGLMLRFALFELGFAVALIWVNLLA